MSGESHKQPCTTVATVEDNTVEGNGFTSLSTFLNSSYPISLNRVFIESKVRSTNGGTLPATGSSTLRGNSFHFTQFLEGNTDREKRTLVHSKQSDLWYDCTSEAAQLTSTRNTTRLPPISFMLFHLAAITFVSTLRPHTRVACCMHRAGPPCDPRANGIPSWVPIGWWNCTWTTYSVCYQKSQFLCRTLFKKVSKQGL